MQELVIHTHAVKGRIEPEVYGHFAEHLGSCIYGGIYVGKDSSIPNRNGIRSDVADALKELSVPLLRWPGGCFAEEYNWRDGIGPQEQRKTIVNNIWGGVTENNSFGTHEFMELCEQLGCKKYINGSVSYATPRDNGEWIEYMTFDGVSPMSDLRKKHGHPDPWQIEYYGVGNENWGNGGNMLPEYYGNLYRQYATYVRSYDKQNPVKRICGGPNVDDYEWMDTVMKTCFRRCPDELHGFMDLISLHYYVHPGGWENKGSATDFSDEEWYITMSKAMYMNDLIQHHTAIMDRYDPEKKVGLAVDEWGDWFDCELGTNPGFLYQQNTIRDALVAGITLNIFNKHCDRVKMACLAQMVNVLQAVILTDGPKMLRTPTYHVLHMYRHHQGAQLLDSIITDVPSVNINEKSIPVVTESVSQKYGLISVTINNLSLNEKQSVVVRLASGANFTVKEALIVSGAAGDKNTFEQPDLITEQPFKDYTEENDRLCLHLPPCSVVLIRMKEC